MTTVQPIRNRILVRQDEAQAVSDKGVIIPTQAQERPKEGVVVAVGEGEFNTYTGTVRPLTVKVGDRVLFTTYAGTTIRVDGVPFLMMTEDEVLAVVRGDPA